MAKQRTPPSVDVIVATIKHSSLPYILVEDTSMEMADVYNKIDSAIGATNALIFYCGGRKAILEIYNRRNEFPNKKVAYVADNDLWIFSGVPVKYNEVCFTQGYSIENDLYIDGENQINVLLDETEQIAISQITNEMVKWYACKIEQYNNDNSIALYFKNAKVLSPHVFDRNTNLFTTQFLTDTNYSEPPVGIVTSISNNYLLELRGKFLFDILMLTFQKRGGQAISYTPKQLLDICIRNGLQDANSNINKLIDCIKNKLGLKASTDT